MAADYSTIKLKTENRDKIRERADALAMERGLLPEEVSIPTYIMEASQWYEDNRPKVEADEVLHD